jgi:hypothetical protein
MDQKQKVTQALRVAKFRRTAAASSCKATEEGMRADAALEVAAQANVAKLERMYDAFIAAGVAAVHGREHEHAIAQVLACKSGLLRATVAFDIAKSRASASFTKHSVAIAELHGAEAGVAQAARVVLDTEMTELAHEFTAAFDHALALGAQLVALSARDHLCTPLNVSIPPMPAEVTRALERIPKRNPYDIPVSELRGTNGSSNAWAKRLEVLAA